MADLSALNLSRRVRGILERNGVTDLSSLLKLNEREVLALPGFGPGCLTELRQALVSTELGELAVDPYASYVCARHGVPAKDATLSDLFLCDDCAAKWQAEAFGGQDPAYVGAPVGGFCLNCNVERPDVCLRQWFLCGTCERVARSIGRSVVAERYVMAQWDQGITPVTPHLHLRKTDEPTLRRRERDASETKTAEIDFAAQDEDEKDAFGFELKTGRSHISGLAQVGSRISEFQLDTSDCDDITTVIDREGIPVYLLHVQVIDRAHPPTLEYKALAGWWTDVFRMAEHFKRIRVRPRETRNAAYYDTAMFEPLDTFAEHLRSGEYKKLAERLRREGIPDLYS